MAIFMLEENWGLNISNVRESILHDSNSSRKVHLTVMSAKHCDYFFSLLSLCSSFKKSHNQFRQKLLTPEADEWFNFIFYSVTQQLSSI